MSSHRHEHHAHHFSATGRTLLLALLVTAGYSVVEALSAHVVLADMADWDAVLMRLRHLLCERYGIDHLTLQPEPETAVVRWLDREDSD